MNYIYYVLTVTAHDKKASITPEQLEEVFQWLEQEYEHLVIVNVGIEDSGIYGQLHGHICVRNPVPLYYKGKTKFKQFRIYYGRLYTEADLHNAQLYCSKEQYSTHKFSPDSPED